MCVTAAALDAPVAALIERCGTPVAVASRDDGAHFLFRSGATRVDAIVDVDKGNVRALDISAPAGERFTFPVDGTPRAFTFGTLTQAQAQASLAAETEYTQADGGAFQPDPAHELVLLFDRADHTLAHLFVGDGGAMGQLQSIPRPPGRAPFPFTAPVLKHTAVHGETGSRTTIVRLDVDKFGIVRGVTVVAPSTDGAYDDGLKARLSNDKYAPATLSGRPVGGSVYRELHH